MAAEISDQHKLLGITYSTAVGIGRIQMRSAGALQDPSDLDVKRKLVQLNGRDVQSKIFFRPHIYHMMPSSDPSHRAWSSTNAPLSTSN